MRSFRNSVRYFKESEKGRGEMCAIIEEYGMEQRAEGREEEISVIEPICRMAEQFAPEYDWQSVKERVLFLEPFKEEQ